MDERHVELKTDGDQAVSVGDGIERSYIFEKDFKEQHLGAGEWVDEPDEADFNHKGIICYIKRIGKWDGHNQDHLFGGHLCGYCRIPENHPEFAKTDDYPEYCVHQGITYNNLDKEGHWIGFDCAHSFDLIPSIAKDDLEDSLSDKLFPMPEEWPEDTYKNFDFVIAETKKLAEQIVERINGKY